MTQNPKFLRCCPVLRPLPTAPLAAAGTCSYSLSVRLCVAAQLWHFFWWLKSSTGPQRAGPRKTHQVTGARPLPIRPCEVRPCCASSINRVLKLEMPRTDRGSALRAGALLSPGPRSAALARGLDSSHSLHAAPAQSCPPVAAASAAAGVRPVARWCLRGPSSTTTAPCGRRAGDQPWTCRHTAG